MKKYSQYGRVKKFFHEYDMFKSPANLRFNEEPDVSQYCSGVFSMLLFAFFAYVLINQFVKLGRFQSIESTQLRETEVDLSAPTASNIQFSFTPAWLLKKTFQKFFSMDIAIKYSADLNKSQEAIPVQACQQSKWSKFSVLYNDLQFGQNLCPQNSSAVKIAGASYINNQSYLSITVKRCTPDTSSTCANDSAFQTQFAKMNAEASNYMSFYIVDTSINSKKIDPIEEFVRSNYDFVYTSDGRVRAEIYLGTYVVQTDSSTWPLSDGVDTLTGYYIESFSVYYVQKQPEKFLKNKDIYGQLQVYMSNKRKHYTRKIGKIDTVISYAGGLFGILIGIFAYFINSYNEYSYELKVAESAFNYDEHGNKVKEKHFNFFRYIEFTAYDWIKFMLCYECKWDYDQKKDQTRQEANMTLDVIHLFRKIQLIELVLSYTIDENSLKLKNLTKPPTLKEVQNKRQCMEYYYAVIRGKFAINLEDIKNNTTSLTEYRRIVGLMRKHEKIVPVADLKDSKNNDNGSGNENKVKGHAPKRQLFRNASIETENMMVSTKNLNPGDNMDNFNQQLSREEELRQQMRREIIHKFTLYSGIEDKELIEGIAEFPQIAQQAKNTQLHPEMLKVEDEFADAYVGLNPEIKGKILDRIPIKILHRLINKIQAKRNGANSNGNNGYGQGIPSLNSF